RAISDACNHRPRRTVPDEDDVAQILVLQHVDDVGDVHVEADLSASEMTPFAETRQRRREHWVPLLTEKRDDLLPEPPSVPGRVNQNEDFRFHSLRLHSPRRQGRAHHTEETCATSGGSEQVTT